MNHALIAPAPGRPAVTRITPIVVCVGVVVCHALALWALQSGLLRRPVEVLVPVQLLAQWVSPTTPPLPTKAALPAPAPLLPPLAPRRIPHQPHATPALPPPPMPLAVADTPPAPNAPQGVVAPQSPLAMQTPVATVASTAITTTSAPASTTGPTAPLVTPRVELPSSNADYLQNPKPQYPGMSKRLGEQGQVIHSVLIGLDGLPVSAQLIQSSGFSRLDQAAYAAVMRWRYVPGKRNGVPTAMSFNVPINWVLE